jgi:outer membrane protein TolC
VRLRDPRVLAAQLEAQRAFERTARVSAQRLPQASVAYDFGRQHVDDSTVSGATRGSKDLRAPSLNVVWDVDLFHGTRASIAEALSVARQGEEKYRQSWSLVVLETVEAYVNVFRLREQLQVTRETLRHYSRMVKVMDERVGAELAPQARLSDAMLRLREALDERNELRTQLAEASQAWRLLVGDDPPQDLMPPRPAPGYGGPDTLDLDRLLAQALADQPQLRANRHSIEGNRRALEAQAANVYPRVSLFLSANEADPASANGSYAGSPRERATAAGVRLSWSFFGLAPGNSIAEQSLALRQNQAEDDRLRRDVERNLRNTVDVLSGIDERRQVSGRTLVIADAVFQQRQAVFQTQSMGEEAVLGLTGAIQSRARAKVALLNLESREVIASYYLLQGSGQLLRWFPPPMQVIEEAPIRHFGAGP